MATDKRLLLVVYKVMATCLSVQAWVAFTCSNCTGSPLSLNNTAGFAYALAEVDLDATGRIGKQVQLTPHNAFGLTLHAIAIQHLLPGECHA